MSNKQLTSTVIAIIAAGMGLSAQEAAPIPKLVVNIAIDQLRTDYLEELEPLYGNYGLKRLIHDGIFYTNVQYPFIPIDRASALAAINTGTSPNYNGITAAEWFDRNTEHIVSCVEDINYTGIKTKDHSSAQNILTTTISDELKIKSWGLSQVYSIAEDRESAIMSAGHNADGVYWINSLDNTWCSSTYYAKELPQWLENYNKNEKFSNKPQSLNEQITELAIKCVSANSLGKDNSTDLLCLKYDASTQLSKNGSDNTKEIYTSIDSSLEKLFTKLQSTIGLNNILFVVTGTGYAEEPNRQNLKFRLPSGTFYINRTANLLNMYLGALYGSDKYIEGIYNNHIFLNQKTLDKKKLNLNEITEISKAFLRQSQGVTNVFSGSETMSAYMPELERRKRGYRTVSCGDIIIEITPGWNVSNEDTNQQFKQNNFYIPTPLIFYGMKIKGKKLTTPVSVEKVSPTIAKTINIRAPNACKESSLFLND